MAVLDQIKYDPERYVQLSVGNWLNDAYRSQPAWVLELCKSWQGGEQAAPSLIIRRALRNHSD